MIGPWKPPAVHDDATERLTMAAHELRERVDNNVGTELDRLAQDG